MCVWRKKNQQAAPLWKTINCQRGGCSAHEGTVLEATAWNRRWWATPRLLSDDCCHLFSPNKSTNRRRAAKTPSQRQPLISGGRTRSCARVRGNKPVTAESRFEFVSWHIEPGEADGTKLARPTFSFFFSLFVWEWATNKGCTHGEKICSHSAHFRRIHVLILFDSTRWCLNRRTALHVVLCAKKHVYARYCKHARPRTYFMPLSPFWIMLVYHPKIVHLMPIYRIKWWGGGSFHFNSSHLNWNML